MIIDEQDYLAHYGVARRSGRYPWGSTGNVISYVDDLKKQGLSEVEIARGLDMSTTRLRALKSIAKNEKRAADIAMITRLADKGTSNVEIGRRLGMPESTVRALRKPEAQQRADILQATAKDLRDSVAESGYIDIGKGVENHMGISADRLRTAVEILREEGYEVHNPKVLQLGTGMETTLKVLAAPDTGYSEVYQNKDNIRLPLGYSEDKGRSYRKIYPPLSVDPKRVAVNYAEDGGAKADGVIYLREGVSDISLGDNRYAQVRIAVGDSHYLKGMAMYSDDMPEGVDLVFNTNKAKADPKIKTDLDAMKEMERNEDGSLSDNPFSSSVRQITERINDDTVVVTSALNIVNEEGDWNRWSQNLSPQILSKQPKSLAEAQLRMTYERRVNEFEAIKQLTNPTVRRKLLEEFADGTDSAAVHLKAASLPRQGWHAILPINDLKEGEVYAPDYETGETVVLIRYPHGGRFEIPSLVVNNNHPTSKRLLGQARDAIGINYKVAERLSGADFDGDTVLVIPNRDAKIKVQPALEGLRDFDSRMAYPGYEGMPKMSSRRKQQEMGNVSNLITDMTIMGASAREMAQAVRHSMVVIDAEKHNLNFKQSALDNGIAGLKKKYQGRADAGATTLISRAKSQVRVDERKPRPAAEGGPIDPKTGKKVFVPTGRVSYKTGNPKLEKAQRLSLVDDAHELSSGTPIERVYADHSNKLKALANRVRLEVFNTPTTKYSPSAKKAYAPQVQRLNAALDLALRNAPLERQAQILANARVKQVRHERPDMDDETLKKQQYLALDEARVRTGADKQRIVIAPDEWDAIQAGAISESRLSAILANADMDSVRELAAPTQRVLMTATQSGRARTMLAAGYTRNEVAAQLGVSVSTLDRDLYPQEGA